MIKAIPEGWKRVRLADVAEHIGIKAEPGTVPYVEIGDVSAGKWIYEVKDKPAPIGAIQAIENDICISNVRPTRQAVVQLKEDAAVSAGFTVLRDKGNTEWPFVFQVVKQKHFFDRLGVLATGSTYPTCSPADVLSFEFSLPPLPEQHKIAAILGSVDMAIEKTRAVIEQTRSLKRAMMQELLTRGIPGRHKKFKKTPVGEIPEEWEVVRLEKAILSGPQNGLYRHESDYGNGTRIVRIDCFNDGKFYNTDFKRVNISEDDIALYKVEFRDILINRVNSMSHLGKAAIFPMIDEPTVFESNMMRIRLDENMMLPEYAILWLCSRQIKKQIEDSAKKAIAQCSINQTDVKNFLFPCPSIGEQLGIVKAFTVMESFYNTNVKQLEGKETLKAALMNQLLTGEIRVKKED